MKKAKKLLFAAVFLIALFALPATAHAAWKKITDEKQKIGNQTIWKEYNDLKIQNNKTGKLKTFPFHYSCQAITDGKTMYYTDRYGKSGGYIDYFKYNFATGKSTRMIRIKDGEYRGNILVAYRNGYLYLCCTTGTHYVLRRMNVSTKKISVVKDHFTASEWDGKRTIKGYDDTNGQWKPAKIRI